MVDRAIEQLSIVRDVGPRLGFAVVERLRFDRRGVTAREQPLIQPL